MKTNETMISNNQVDGTNNQNRNSTDMDSLINRVKAEDAKNLYLTKTFQ